MILFTRAIDGQGQERQFCTNFIDLKEALHFLEGFGKFGDRVVAAYLIELNGGGFEIPLELLDEQAHNSPFQQLKAQWEMALRPS